MRRAPVANASRGHNLQTRPARFWANRLFPKSLDDTSATSCLELAESWTHRNVVP